MQSISAKLDWKRMLGFEQIADSRAALRTSGRLDAKVGVKVGVKVGGKVGQKV
jgi:hypothetical protein